jgi:hypothetical protein
MLASSSKLLANLILKGYSGQYNEALKKFLVDNSYNQALPDALYYYLGGRGYTGELNERLYQWSLDDYNLGALISIDTAPSFNTALLYIGQTIGAARVAGSYSHVSGTVTEGTITYLVNGVAQLSSYVIQASDATVSSSVALLLDGSPAGQSASTGNVTIPDLVITEDIAASFDLPSLIVGNTLASAYNAGSYTGSHGTITEDVFSFYVDGVARSGSYVLTSDDIEVGAPLIPLLIDGLYTGQFATLPDTLRQNTAPTSVNISITFTVAPGLGDVTAPVLTSPTGTQTGATTADTGVTTDEDNGTLYTVNTTSATAPSKAQVKAGQNNGGTSAVFAANQSISTTGVKGFNATGLTGSTTYYTYFMHEDFAGNQSNVAAASSFTTASADTTAPILTSPTGTKTGETTATGTVDTDENNGSLYAVTTTSVTKPTKAQVKAGQNNGGTAAAWSGNQTITTTGTKNISISGLTASTTYYNHYMHEDAVGNQSTVATSASFTTDAVPTGLTVVGYASAVGTGATITVDLTSLTAIGGGAGGTIADGDIIYVGNSTADASDTNLGPGGSYTELLDLYQADTRATNLDISRLVVSGTPPSSIACKGTNNAGRGGAAIAIVLRGQHATPEDVSSVPSTGPDGTACDPGPITPINAGTFLLYFMAGSRTASLAQPGTTPSGTTEVTHVFGDGTSRGTALMLSIIDNWTSGAVDPGAMTGTPSSTADSWAAGVVAVRKA